MKQFLLPLVMICPVDLCLPPSFIGTCETIQFTYALYALLSPPLLSISKFRCNKTLHVVMMEIQTDWKCFPGRKTIFIRRGRGRSSRQQWGRPNQRPPPSTNWWQHIKCCKLINLKFVARLTVSGRTYKSQLKVLNLEIILNQTTFTSD